MNAIYTAYEFPSLLMAEERASAASGRALRGILTGVFIGSLTWAAIITAIIHLAR